MEETTSTISYVSANLAPIDPVPPPEPIPSRFQWIWAPAVFGLLTFFMFFDLLFTSARVISSDGADLAMQFLAWRDFGFSQLSQGHIPLWNPYVFGGTPYFAGFQSALLYPPNWLHLIMPLGLAINWIVAMHCFMAGYFTYLWCRGRYIGIGGSIIAGVMYMFSGPYFLHLYAGHLPHLAVMIWTPLMLLSLDKLAETGNWKWCILGIAATSMHILAGHPQYVYYTGIVLSIYTLLLMFRHRKTKSAAGLSRWLTLGLGFVAIYVGSVFVTAIQLLPGIQAVGEEVRSGGTQYEFASTFSMPPHNLITLLVPTFFRNMASGYWGAGYLWELSLFVSVAGFTLAVYGICQIRWRRTWIVVAMLLITFTLSLGRHTPFYWPMFKYLPAYGSFRGTAKFAYLAILFLCMLAAMGFDALRTRSVPVGFLAALGIGMAIMTLLGAFVLASSSNGPTGWWADFVRMVINNAILGNEWFPNSNPANDPTFFKPIGHDAAMMCFLAAGTLVGIGLVFVFAGFHRSIPYLMLLIVCIEMFVFAHITRASMTPLYGPASLPQSWQAQVAAMRKDNRVMAAPPMQVNLGMSAGYQNVLGYDPGVLKRYAEMFFAAQGLDPSKADQYLLRIGNPDQFVTPSMIRLMRLLRGQYIFYSPEQPGFPVREPPLPVALLVSDVVQFTGRDPVLGYVLAAPGFDPAKTVVLESSPGVVLQSLQTPPGTVKILNQTNDSMEIQATLDRAAMLVITNNYSTGWRIKPITSAQSDYRIMPANYAQIGIPLEKGNHDFILEYSPFAFRAGRWVSGISLIGLIGASLLLMRRRS